MPRFLILRPPRVQRVRRQNTTQIAEAADEGAGGRDANLAVAGLEDLVGPGHDVGDGGTEAEADNEEAAVARPGVVVAREGGDEEPRDLDEDGDGEDEGAVVVEAVGDGHHEEDGDEVTLWGEGISVMFGGEREKLGERGELTIQIGANRRLRSIPLSLGLIA